MKHSSDSAIAKTIEMKTGRTGKMSGWLALSPLFLFLCIYLISSVVAADFYKVPIAAAFLLASAYALLVTPANSTEKRIEIFSEGAGNRNVLLMIWIFVLAGAFAGTAEDMGAIDSAVNFTLGILPGKSLWASFPGNSFMPVFSWPPVSYPWP